MICQQCSQQLEKEKPDPYYWGFLSETMWSEVPAVQVTAWRMLNLLKQESWASSFLDMMYLDDRVLKWAETVPDKEDLNESPVHRDANGHQLASGDSVVLTKSLDVKGSSVNAKMGTSVRNIRLVENNLEQIEGKIDGQLIVILTKYIRKTS